MKKKVYLLTSAAYSTEIVALKDWSKDDSEYVLAGVGECEFEMIDEAEQVKAAVAALEAAKQKEMADSQRRLNSLDARIQSLLAITHAPEDVQQ
jgi:hypothetical protein